MPLKQESIKLMKDRFIDALESNLGIVMQASQACGISRMSHYKWIKEDEDYARRVNEIETVTLDFAEASLMKQIKEGNPTSTIFFLKTKGKKRGYTEEHTIRMSSEVILPEPPTPPEFDGDGI